MSQEETEDTSETDSAAPESDGTGEETPLEALRRRREESRVGGGEARIERQHDRGKMTAHERVEYLLDDGTFTEIDAFVEHRATSFGMDEKEFPGDAVVTGYGDVNGRTVFVFAHDFTVLGGSVGEVVAEKVCKVMDRATEAGVPVVGLNDSGGARIQEGVDSLVGFAKIFERNTKASISVNVPSSRRYSTRSCAVIFPRSCWRSMRASPPPTRDSSRRRLSASSGVSSSVSANSVPSDSVAAVSSVSSWLISSHHSMPPLTPSTCPVM